MKHIAKFAFFPIALIAVLGGMSFVLLLAKEEEWRGIK